MRLPFPFLHANLIAAFVAVIAVSLLLASGAFAYLLREYQADREKDRLESVAINLSVQVGRSLRSGQTQTAIANQLDLDAAAAQVRILLLNDRGTVVHDTDGNRLSGRDFPVPPAYGRRPNVFQGTLSSPGGEQLFAVVPFGPPTAGLRVAIVAPEQSLTNAWREALPQLSMAAIAALVVSIGIALWLASTITRPIRQITRASEEMARGNYDPDLRLPETNDEVGRLSAAFTTMAREVARSHRAMRDLLANVSHDLRTPLTSVQGFAGALVDGTLAGPDAARDAGRVIGEEAERMRRLVEDLLYLGRIESGELALEKHPVDLAELARAAESRFAFRAQEAGIAFRLVAPEPLALTGDPHRLAQVLDNLLENALKHTPAGGSIDVAVAREAAGRSSGGARVARPAPNGQLSVHNTGSVIPPEEVDRVFERFYQLDKARAGRDGRGLGLAIAREIVQAHKGSLDVESSAERGTTFTIRLPMLESPRVAPLSSAERGRLIEIGSRASVRR